MDFKGNIYVCCHFDAFVPDCKGVKALAVGADSNAFGGAVLKDNSGDNISNLNASYCELTGLYWMWKNVASDYYGLCHYRRYFDFRGGAVPYKLANMPTEKCLAKLGYSKVSDIMAGCDVVLPVPEDFGVKVYEHYVSAPYHHKKDIDLAIEIIYELYPDYKSAVAQYLDGDKCYTGNMAIFSGKQMDSYCTWLFSILTEFDKRCDKSGYSKQELRVNGYLAERLLGIYITYLAKDKSIVIKHYPKVHFLGFGSFKQKLATRVQYLILPPNSKRRVLVRRFVMKNKP